MGPWDAAKKGSGALDAAWESEVAFEHAKHDNRSVIGALLDLQRFYDGVGFDLLA